MKEITLKVPDKKIDFFMELINQLGFEVSQDIEIPEEHKAIVRRRVEASSQHPNRLLDWDEVKDTFQVD